MEKKPVISFKKKSDKTKKKGGGLHDQIKKERKRIGGIRVNPDWSKFKCIEAPRGSRKDKTKNPKKNPQSTNHENPLSLDRE